MLEKLILPEQEATEHYNDVIMSTIASQITSLTIVYPTVYSRADQRKHQSSASLAFVWGIHRWPVNSPHKGPVTREMLPFDDVSIVKCCLVWSLTVLLKNIFLTASVVIIYTGNFGAVELRLDWILKALLVYGLSQSICKDESRPLVVYYSCYRHKTTYQEHIWTIWNASYCKIDKYERLKIDFHIVPMDRHSMLPTTYLHG